MPGIGGFIINDEKNLAQKSKLFLSKMLWDQTYSARSFLDKKNNLAQHAASNAIVPFCKMELQGRYRCVFYGELYPVNRDKTENDFKKNITSFFTAFLEKGQEALLDTDGAFLFSVWDAKEKTLIAGNDVFGLYPLNYYHDKNTFIFSSQIFAIVSLLPGIEQDETAIAELLAVGMPLNGRSWFKGIKRLLPGSLLRFEKGKLQEKQYYRASYNPVETGLKNRLATINAHFEDAVEKRYSSRERTAVALSGGFDSRAIWSIYLGKKFPATAITRGLKNSADMQIAGQITETLNIPHKTYYLDNPSFAEFPDWAAELITMSEGFMNVRQSLLVPYYRDLGKSFDVLIDSSGGALYRRQAFWRYGMPGTASKDLTRFTYLIQRKKMFADGTVKSEYKENFEEKIIQDIRNYYQSIEQAGQAGDLLDLYYLQQVCSLRTSADLMFQSHFINCRQPFYDRQAFNSVQSFSTKERKKLHIHRALLQRNFPRLKNFPLESGDYIIPYYGFRQKRLLPLALERTFPLFRFKKYPLQKPGNYFNKDLNTFTKEILLDPKTVSRPLWNGNQFEEIIINHEQNRGDYSETFFNLLTVELFLRRLENI